MSREISRIFPSSNVASSNFGKGKNRGSRNVSAIKQNGQRGKKKGLIVKNNGVDISDLTRYYSKEEWRKLDSDVKKKILDAPARKNLRAEKDKRDISAIDVTSLRSGGSKDGISVVTGSSIDKDSEDRIVAAVIRGVMESSRTNQEERNVGEVTSHTPSHGSRVGASVGSVTGSVRSRGSSVTFGPSASNRG